MRQIKITEHAFDRAKERMGLDRHATERLLKRVVLEGVDVTKVKGRIRKFINSTLIKGQNANLIKLFGEFMFLFKKKSKEFVLLTVMHLPVEIRNYKIYIKH